MKQKLFYFFSAFVCGAAVMAVEMTGTRLLAPYFGSSLFVWTNTISVILVSMAVGYSIGGRMADRHPDPRIYFFWILVTGLWVMAIPFVTPYLLPHLASGLGNLETALRLGSFVAVLLLFAFPILLLGFVVPFTMRLTADSVKTVGSLSGVISTISTVGSLMGTLLPAFVLIPLWGSSVTFFGIGWVLFLLAAIGLRKPILLVLGILGALFFAMVPSVYSASDLLAEFESPYAYIFVTEDQKGIRALHIDNTVGVQSLYDPDKVLPPASYYYSYFGVLPALVEQPRSVLILGHAGGSFTRIFNMYYPELQITGVELDPAVTQLAQKYMGLSGAQVSLVHADARQFLLNTSEHYDLILVDTYRGVSIPAHLATVEFFTLCRDHLTFQGLLALNAASNQGEFLGELTRSLAQPFGGVFSFPVPGSFNTMLVAGLSQLDQSFSLPSDLEPLLAKIRQKASWFSANGGSVFHDEKLPEVELKNEAMFMQLLSQFH